MAMGAERMPGGSEGVALKSEHVQAAKAGKKLMKKKSKKVGKKGKKVEDID